MVISKVLVEKANRLYQMPPDLMSFARSDKRAGLLRRKDTLDLATFNWPVPFPDQFPTGAKALTPPDQARLDELKEQLAEWLSKRYNCKISPEKEIFIGSGISGLLLGLTLSLVDHGDVAFVPQLGVPLYRKVVACVGGESIVYPVTSRNDWKPDFERLSSRLGRVARVMFLNSPHNPTGAELNTRDFTRLVFDAGRENVLLINDAAYQSLPEREPVSLLSAAGGRRVGVEVYSLAYLLGLPYYPYGLVVGNRDAISALKQIEALSRATVPGYFIDMISSAIKTYPSPALRQLRRSFAKARGAAVELAEALQLEPTGAESVPFLWARLTRRRQGQTFASQLQRRHRILCLPGSELGDSGEGYVRFSLTAGAEAFETALKRVRRKRRLKLEEGDA